MYARVETDELHDLADAELIRQLQSGDDDALNALMQRHAEPLYRFCCHLTPSREDAEDICQESMARAISRVGSLRAGSAFRSWLFSIARNLSIDTFRSKKRICPLPEGEVVPFPLHADGPHDRVEVGEEHQTVAQALGRLAQSHQHVLLLREVEGLSYADIARRMNVSQSAVETLLFRARRRLREEYGKSGVTPGAAFLGALKAAAMRLAPIASAPTVAKVAVTAAVVGSAVVSSRHVPLVRHQAAALARPRSQTGSVRKTVHRATVAPTITRRASISTSLPRPFSAAAGTAPRRTHIRSVTRIIARKPSPSRRPAVHHATRSATHAVALVKRSTPRWSAPASVPAPVTALVARPVPAAVTVPQVARPAGTTHAIYRTAHPTHPQRATLSGHPAHPAGRTSVARSGAGTHSASRQPVVRSAHPAVPAGRPAARAVGRGKHQPAALHTDTRTAPPSTAGTLVPIPTASAPGPGKAATARGPGHGNGQTETAPASTPVVATAEASPSAPAGSTPSASAPPGNANGHGKHH